VPKALFVHDHPFYHLNDVFYSPGRLTAANWARYIDTGLVDELTVVSRGIEISSYQEGLVESSCPSVVFSPIYNVKGGAGYLKHFFDIKRKLQENIERVDVVIIRAPSFFGSLAYICCKEVGKPYIVEVVGCAWESVWTHGSVAGKLIAPFLAVNTKLMVRNCDAVLYVTKEFLQERYQANARSVVSHASNVHIPDPLEKVLQQRLRKITNAIRNKLECRIGILADVSVKYKGYEVAIKALYDLKARAPQLKFKFLIAGGGRSDYEKKIIKKYNLNDRVELVGQLSSGKDVFDFLDMVDLYIQPSLTEGLPRSTIEAMSRGCPVLASSAGGIPELIESTFLHRPGDSHKLSRDIELVLTDSEKMIEMARANFERSKEYTNELLAKRRVGFYRAAFEEIFGS
tara:strand:- start:2915 stop:4117 length:1203 start_codon:yes stop_codon:yes gene_type:complete